MSTILSLVFPPGITSTSGINCGGLKKWRPIKRSGLLVSAAISLIGNVLLRQLSAEADAVETILFRDGKLTEASASNVFIVKGGVIQSPPKNELILPGITYDVIVELARAHALPLEFREITQAEVRGADELWVSSSSKEVLAIVQLDGRPVGDARPGPGFRRMYRLYQDFKHQVMRAGRRERVSA